MARRTCVAGCHSLFTAVCDMVCNIVGDVWATQQQGRRHCQEGRYQQKTKNGSKNKNGSKLKTFSAAGQQTRLGFTCK